MAEPSRTEKTPVAIAQLNATDALTGLTSRHAFFLRGERIADRARKQGQPLALLLVDLDHFKQVNLDHGIQVTDAVLKEIGERLRGNTREKDLAARVAGQVFAVLCLDMERDDVLRYADDLRSCIAKTPCPVPHGASFMMPEGGRVPITVSIGVASYDPVLDRGIEDLMRRADAKMLEAKKAGRNCVRS